MRCWPRTPEFAAALAAVLIAGCHGANGDAGLHVESLVLTRAVDAVVLHPRLDLSLSDPVLEALHNGVPVALLMEARLERKRPWAWPELHAAEERRYVITYHSLSDQYLVHEGKGAALRTFPSRAAVLVALESPEPWPLALPQDDEGDAPWRAAVRVRLDLDALPAPLRLVALFSPGWRIGSPWHRETLPP